MSITILEPSQLNLKTELLEQKHSFYVTAPLPQQGCTSVVMSLGIHLQKTTQRNVLIVDGNQGTVSARNHESSANGFSNINSDINVDMVKSWIKSDFEHPIDILPFGNNLDSAAQLSQLEAYRFMLSSLKRDYSYILLDAPNVSVSKSSLRIAQAFDGAILVVASESAKKGVAKHACEQLEMFGAKLIGSIFNRRKHYIPQVIYDLI